MTGIDGRAAVATELSTVRSTVADAIARNNQLNTNIVALSTLVNTPASWSHSHAFSLPVRVGGCP